MYNAYTLTQSTPLDNNTSANVELTITGDAGEAPFVLNLNTNDPSNIDQQANDTMAKLNDDAARAARLAAFLASPPIGQSLVPAPVDNTPSPQQQYQSDLQILNQLIAAKQAMGIDITQDAEVQALQQQVQNEYAPAFVLPAATLTSINTAIAAKTTSVPAQAAKN